MATAPVKSQPLHNFSLPLLKWGGKNQTNTNHRCRRPISGDHSHATATVTDHSSEPDSEPETRAHRVGSRTARNRFGFSQCYMGEKSQKQQHTSERASNNETDDEAGEKKRETEDAEEAEPEEAVQKPWNLRPRKPLFSKVAVEIGVGPLRNGELQETVLTASAVHHSENPPQPKSLRLRGFTETLSTQRKEKRKFWIALSREEIEEDIFAMTGSRPARRPKKRPKIVQKQVDSVFPGLWLVGVTADAYRVADGSAKVLSRLFSLSNYNASCYEVEKLRQLQFAESDDVVVAAGNKTPDWRLPYIVGGQNNKHIVNLQTPNSILDLVLEALLAS
ncbi:hypothetical protein L6164_028057 [Bauhinia variegata]|uniref:Uncharacterized protein n=1 Tax=Bauhinia variegata TaxID=167791 RepID=A0ACB9LV81_BAUVA|nr:hypothetical protein L6164_028057 [Bauhinia variegata]